jgi:transcriptional regulator with XRE-family HTH domain
MVVVADASEGWAMIDRKISSAMAEVRRLREARGITQLDAAYRAGFSQVQVNRWENGYNHPSIYAFATYIEALGFKLTIVPSSPMDD